ncbi:MAG: hypothetical protein B6247_23390 [Candidatus Parabeggiatoa sp. nov. 2]|nr:MAG: hypothetical protein B6247_23390 [Beggiatoa sp. 4572_84]
MDDTNELSHGPLIRPVRLKDKREGLIGRHLKALVSFDKANRIETPDLIGRHVGYFRAAL